VNDIRVLIIDDDKMLRLALEEFLKADGYTVVSAGTAHEALVAQRESSFDVCIVDLHVPDMDGTQAILKLHEICVRSQFILYTGFSNYTLPPVLAALGMANSQIVHKPILNMDSFIALIDDLAERVCASQTLSTPGTALVDTDTAHEKSTYTL
jgi:DNA-binding NtrC family response regulator